MSNSLAAMRRASREGGFGAMATVGRRKRSLT